MLQLHLNLLSFEHILLLLLVFFIDSRSLNVKHLSTRTGTLVERLCEETHVRRVVSLNTSVPILRWIICHIYLLEQVY